MRNKNITAQALRALLLIVHHSALIIALAVASASAGAAALAPGDFEISITHQNLRRS